jgi:hypothetical protein
MTRPFLRPLVATTLLVFGAFASGASAQSVAATQTGATSASAESHSPMLWSSSTPTRDESAGAAQPIPDAPTPQDEDGQQTKRILGIVPNFRAVSANQKLPPMSVKDKFVTASEDSFDYSAVFLPAAVAGYNTARNSTPEFGHGGVGYGRYLWHSLVDQTSENYFVEFIGPALIHEDPRYYTLGSGGFFRRTGYALSRAVITRNDAGKEVFNASEIVGSGAASGISNLYYPSQERTFGNTADQWGLDLGIDAATFVFKEFWPDINQALFHGKQ